MQVLLLSCQGSLPRHIIPTTHTWTNLLLSKISNSRFPTKQFYVVSFVLHVKTTEREYLDQRTSSEPIRTSHNHLTQPFPRSKAVPKTPNNFFGSTLKRQPCPISNRNCTNSNHKKSDLGRERSWFGGHCKKEQRLNAWGARREGHHRKMGVVRWVTFLHVTGRK